MSQKKYDEWTPEDSVLWLEEHLRLPQYKTEFMNMALDGTMFDFITDQDLENDLNIKVRLHRVKIIEGIKRLKSMACQPQPMSEPNSVLQQQQTFVPQIQVQPNSASQQMAFQPPSSDVMMSSSVVNQNQQQNSNPFLNNLQQPLGRQVSQQTHQPVQPMIPQNQQ